MARVGLPSTHSAESFNHPSILCNGLGAFTNTRTYLCIPFHSVIPPGGPSTSRYVRQHANFQNPDHFHRPRDGSISTISRFVRRPGSLHRGTQVPRFLNIHPSPIWDASSPRLSQDGNMILPASWFHCPPAMRWYSAERRHDAGYGVIRSIGEPCCSLSIDCASGVRRYRSKKYKPAILPFVFPM